MNRIVVDASALLAFLHDGPGATRVSAVLERSVVSTVNWSEVVQKALARGIRVEGMALDFEDLGVEFAPLTLTQGERAAQLWDTARAHGLSLADRACLALAMERERPVLTADRAREGPARQNGIAVEWLR
ncbi:MAG: PIN domain-containing protein [Pseudomonadota bacterium]